MSAHAGVGGPPTGIDSAQLKERANALRLMGLLAHWGVVQSDPQRLAWTGELLACEESEASELVAALSDGCAPRTSGASSRWSTSTGTGRPTATGRPCRADDAVVHDRRHQRCAGRPHRVRDIMLTSPRY